MLLPNPTHLHPPWQVKRLTVGVRLGAHQRGGEVRHVQFDWLVLTCWSYRPVSTAVIDKWLTFLAIVHVVDLCQKDYVITSVECLMGSAFEHGQRILENGAIALRR